MFVFFSSKIFCRGSHQYNIKTLKIFCCICPVVIYNHKKVLKTAHSICEIRCIHQLQLPWISKVLLYMVCSNGGKVCYVFVLILFHCLLSSIFNNPLWLTVLLSVWTVKCCHYQSTNPKRSNPLSSMLLVQFY